MILVVKGYARLSKRGSTIIVSVPKRDAETKSVNWENISVPILDLEALIVVGSRVRVSSGVLVMLAEARVPVLIHSRSGDSFLMNPLDVRVAEIRRRLYKMIDDPSWRVTIGRAFISGKILGMINVARYLLYKERERGVDTSQTLNILSDYVEKFRWGIERVRSIEEIRSIEAEWSRKLWEILSRFIPPEYDFRGRAPKSRDPINASISYSYAVIYNICTHALIAAGLDPYVGIIHSERAGKSSLTYDFSEMFKPIAIHSVIIASRETTLETDSEGHLTKASLETVSRTLYRLLKRKHREWKYTARGEIYSKAFELRQNIEKGTRLLPFIYQIK